MGEAKVVGIRQKMSPEMENAEIHKHEFEKNIDNLQKNLLGAKSEEAPGAESQQELVTPRAMPTVTMAVDDLAQLIASAAQGRRLPVQAALPQSESVVERVLDGTLGAVGDGAHRIADGARDIVGGIIDIVTLGRAGRKR